MNRFLRLRSHPVLLWTIAIFVAFSVIILSHYESSDPDSEFYTFLVRQLHERPWTDWLTPQWMGRQNLALIGYVQDHFVGHLIPALLLSAAGFPALQSLYALNIFYTAATLWMSCACANQFFSEKTSQSLLWSLQFLIIAFAYRIRANHEQLVLLTSLVGGYAGARMRKHLGWVSLVAVATCVCFLVKGVVFFIVIGAAAIAFSTDFFAMSRARFLSGALLIFLALLSPVLLAVPYEIQYIAVNGESILKPYWAIQIWGRSVVVEASGGPSWLLRLRNIGYYLGAGVWFSMPSTIVLGWWIYSCRKWWRLKSQKHCLNTKWTAIRLIRSIRSIRSIRWGEWLRAVRLLFSKPETKGFVLFFTVSLSIIFIFSMSNRTGVRYVFPLYGFLGVGCMLSLAIVSPKFFSLIERVNAWGVHRFSALLWLFFVVVTVVTTNVGPLRGSREGDVKNLFEGARVLKRELKAGRAQVSEVNRLRFSTNSVAVILSYFESLNIKAVRTNFGSYAAIKIVPGNTSDLNKLAAASSKPVVFVPDALLFLSSGVISDMEILSEKDIWKAAL